MKLNLSQWNPFKFFRKTPEDKRAEPSSSTALATTAGHGSTAWPASSRLLTAEPLRLMQELLRDPWAGMGALDHWFGDFSPSGFQPGIDVVDDGEALRISAELPGMDREDVEIVVEGDVLVLRGEKHLESQTEEQGCYRLERAFGRFERVIPLPDGVDVDRAEARFDKAVLTIRLPKVVTEPPAVRRLEIT
jgi:HSP20 family protein